MTQRITLALLLVCSRVCVVRLELETVFKTACIDRVLVLFCPVKGKSGEFLWKYKEYPYDNWQEIGFSSNNTASLSRNMPPKFKDMIHFSQRHLQITSFKPDLSGMYNCQSDNKGQVLHGMFTVVAITCEKAVCEDDDVIIECDLLKYKILLPPGLNQSRELQWKNKRKTLVVMGPNMKVTFQDSSFSNTGSMQEDGALRIRSASKDIDGQRYTCVLHGEIGVTSRRCSVVINVQKCETKINNTCEEDSIDLKCPYYQELATNDRDVRLEWYNGSSMIAMLHTSKGRSILSESLKINRTNGLLTLLSPGVIDSGLYRCKVIRDKVLLAEHSVTLNVTQCPSPTNHQTLTKSVSKGQSKKIRDIFLFLFFAVLVAFVLPFGLYRMVKKKKPHVIFL